MEPLQPGLISDDLRKDFIAFFFISGQQFAIDLSTVKRIQEIEEGNDAGDLQLIKLSEVLQISINKEAKRTSYGVFILEKEESEIGFVVDAVSGMDAKVKMEELKFPPVLKGKVASVFTGFLKHGEDLVPIINANTIISELTLPIP